MDCRIGVIDSGCVTDRRFANLNVFRVTYIGFIGTTIMCLSICNSKANEQESLGGKLEKDHTTKLPCGQFSMIS